MEKEVGFEHLHLHTDYSLLDGYGQVEEYAYRATQINQKFLCVTDHGMLGAIPRQIRACEVMGIQPILGIELYLNDKHVPKKEMAKLDLTDEEKAAIGKNYHLLCIAHSDEGYSNLVQLSSKAWLQFYKKARVTYAQIEEHKKGITFTSSCYIGEIGQAFDRYGPDRAEEELKRYNKWFSPHFYLEMMLLDFKKQKPYNAWLVKMHEKYHIPMIISNDCLVKGTIITTNSGSKCIEDIKVGDKVLTHENEYKEVEFVNVRPLESNEKVYRVVTSRGTFAWEVTGNHLVRVAQVKNRSWNDQIKQVHSYCWKRVDDLLPNEDYLVVPKINKSSVFSTFDLLNIDVMDFLSESDLTQKEGCVDGLNYSFSVTYNSDNRSFVSFQGFDKRKCITIPRFLPLDDDFLRIIGLYMAEGELDRNGNVIVFGTHVNETDEQHLINKYFSKFGISLMTRTEGNGFKTSFSSKVFRKLFEGLCGIGGKNKSFPQIDGRSFGKLSENQIVKILSQYIKGDGYRAEIHIRPSSISSTSKKLIYDLATFLNALGFFVVPYVTQPKNKKHKNPRANPELWNIIYTIAFGSNVKVKLENFIYSENKQEKIKLKNTGNKHIECDEGYAVKFKRRVEISYEEQVYNLQVQDDESYVANLYQVHNCHYCRKEDSQQQRYMLMIRGKKTIKDFETLEDGKDYFELQDTNLWMKSEEELDEKWREMYSDVIPAEVYTEAKRNTVRIAQKAAGVQVDRSIKLPQIPDADLRLKEAALQGYKWRGFGMDKKYVARLKEELDLICKKGFAAYFLIQQEIVKDARRICPEILGWGNGEEAIGPGRGCLTPEVKVVMGNGSSKPISEFKIGDTVVTRDGSIQIVENVLIYDCDEVMVKIKTHHGSEKGVTLTKDHKVLINVHGFLRWVMASEIKIDDWLFMPDSVFLKNKNLGNDTFSIKTHNGFLLQVKEVTELSYCGKVYDLTVKNNHNYATTSFLVHNSAGGSLICYCLGITDVDPLKHDLLFSRFLSESRGGREMKTRFSGIEIPDED